MATLREVFIAERKYRLASRRLRFNDGGKWREQAPPIGIALSGGGIRSATFNLGLIQSFAQHRLLHFFDYLSTVSGGGYIGSWLMAWMHNQINNPLRNQKASIRDAEIEFGLKRYNPLIDNERPSVRFLRSHSRYLSPQLGLLSADPWTLGTTYLRNTILNFVIFSAVLTFLLLIPRWITAACLAISDEAYIHRIPTIGGVPVWALLLASVLASTCMWYIGRNLANTPFSGKKLAEQFPKYTQQGWVQLTCVSTLFAACALYSVALHRALEYNAKYFHFGYLNTDAKDFKLFTVNKLNIKLFLIGAVLYAVFFGVAILAGNLLMLIKHMVITPERYRLGRIVIAVGSCVKTMGRWITNNILKRLYAVIALLDHGYSRRSMQKFAMSRIGSAFIKKGSDILSLINLRRLVTFISIVEPQPDVLRKHMRKLAEWGVAAAVVHGIFLVVVLQIFEKIRHRPEALWLVVGFGTSLLVGALQITAAFHIGMMGRSLPDGLREWLGRFGAWTMIYNMVWLMTFGVVIYVPAGADVVFRRYPLASISVLALWCMCVVTGIIAARSSETSVLLTRIDHTTAFEYWKKLLLGKLTASAPFIFIAGILGLFALAIACLPTMSVQTGLLLPATENSRSTLLVLTLTCIVAAWFFGWRIDVNEFSMHSLYRNRLVRCYLGASAENRRPQPFTAFDPADDIPLSQFATIADEQAPPWPYLIVNAALNVVKGKDALGLQTRKAKSFIFSPLFCGYDRSKYAVTASWQSVPPKTIAQPRQRIEVEKAAAGPAPARQASPWPMIDDEPDDIPEIASEAVEEPQSYGKTMEGRSKSSAAGISLGTAMAISGAAASPNMGYHTSAATRFLLALFNIRLGEWIGNPNDLDAWSQGTPRFGLYWLLSELFGNTTDESEFLYLSDGGHFENLGIYELVRRRCGLIVVSDASADPEWRFSDLATAIERCRTDFAVSINFKTGAELEHLILESYKVLGEGRSGLEWVREHQGKSEGLKSTKQILDLLRPDTPHPLPLAIAEIDYGGTKGVLIYIKPTLLDDLPLDVTDYARIHRGDDDRFPQQSTVNQFFDETQFECYRTLGTRTGDEVATVVERALRYCLGWTSQ